MITCVCKEEKEDAWRDSFLSPLALENDNSESRSGKLLYAGADSWSGDHHHSSMRNLSSCLGENVPSFFDILLSPHMI